MNKTIALAHKEKISVMRDVIADIESLQLLETIYGFASDVGFRIVGIADTLSGDQRDSIWDINWEFQKKYPHIDIEIILLQRRGRPLAEVFSEGDSAIITREIITH
jgi:hypothetical protein